MHNTLQHTSTTLAALSIIALLGACGSSSGAGTGGTTTPFAPQDAGGTFFADGASSGGASGSSGGDQDAGGSSSGAAPDTVTCTPDCNKKLCGDDGCNGTCGTCGDKEGCVAGVCKKLADPDKCAAAKCDKNAYCTDDGGAAKCVCKPFYEGNGKACSDIDECVTNHGGCHDNALCDNLVGKAPKCTCLKGYYGNGKTCIDNDECKDLKAKVKCAEHGLCKNTVGSYECVCEDGFEGNGSSTCKDIDECEKGTAVCHSNSYCSNSAGGYVCACKDGYVKQGGKCVDDDECKDGSAGCSKNANCTNKTPGYTCTCKAGYTGDGKICSKEDLCKNASCDKNAVCVAGKDGKAACVCNLGFDGDGKACQHVVVNITLHGAVLAPRPATSKSYDPGCSVTATDLKKVKDAAIAAAKLFKDPTVTAIAMAAKLLPIEKALAAVAGQTCKPDAMGTIKLLPSGKTFTLKSGGLADNSFTPVWKNVAWKGVKLINTVNVELFLEESDLFGSNDPIGSVKITHEHLLKAMKLGKIVPIPTADQGTGNIMFVNLAVDQPAKCGNGICETGETSKTCSTDCVSNNGSCKGVCGAYDKSWSCQCDKACIKLGDCCTDFKVMCP